MSISFSRHGRGMCVLLLSLASLAMAANPPTVVEPAEVSLLALIVRPEKFDGRVIRTVGYCWLEYEGNALYVHKEDVDRGIFLNSVRMSLVYPIDKKQQEQSGKYVIVEGRFRAGTRKGVLTSGTIEGITRLDAYPSRAEVKALIERDATRP